MKTKNAEICEDLFTASNDDFLSTRGAAIKCGVSYQKFLRVFWDLPYKFLYPGGPRVYLRSEVKSFLEQKNKIQK